jgi:hypothetical protein
MQVDAVLGGDFSRDLAGVVMAAVDQFDKRAGGVPDSLGQGLDQRVIAAVLSRFLENSRFPVKESRPGATRIQAASAMRTP